MIEEECKDSNWIKGFPIGNLTFLLYLEILEDHLTS